MGDFIFGVCIGIMIGALIWLNLADSYYHEKTVTHSCAQYNAKTGDFEWLDTIGVNK